MFQATDWASKLNFDGPVKVHFPCNGFHNLKQTILYQILLWLKKKIIRLVEFVSIKFDIYKPNKKKQQQQ